MNNCYWIIILILIIFLISSNKESFTNITNYPGPYDYNTRIVSVCQGQFQPCNLYRY
jgi:hypothetical protein